MASRVVFIRQAPNRTRRILLLSTSLGLGGGAEEQVQQLALELHARCWTVGLISLLAPGPPPHEFENSGINIGTLDMQRGVADLGKVAQLARIIRLFRPDVVHSHMPYANILARVVRPLAPMPALVSTLHGSKMDSVNGGSTRFRELAHRFTDRWADVTTAVCRAGADSCVADGAVPKNKVIVLPNGVDTSRYLPRPSVREWMRAKLGVAGKFVWLAAGRFEAPKNYNLMIRSFSFALQHTRREMVLLICGTGSQHQQIEMQVRKLSLESHVRFLGVRPDIPEVMNAADAFLLSSDTEGLPMVLLQAAASGLPVVATAVGGNGEIIQNNYSGFLVPRGNPMAMAAAIDRMSSLNHFDLIRLGRAGRQFTHQHFSLEGVVDQWEQLYFRLLESQNTKRAPA